MRLWYGPWWVSRMVLMRFSEITSVRVSISVVLGLLCAGCGDASSSDEPSIHTRTDVKDAGALLIDAAGDVGTMVDGTLLSDMGSERPDVADSDVPIPPAGTEACIDPGLNCSYVPVCVESTRGLVCTWDCDDNCTGVGPAKAVECALLTLPSGEFIHGCVPVTPRHCMPCTDDTECTSPNWDDAHYPHSDSLPSRLRCISEPEPSRGSFCRISCTDDTGCRTGLACMEGLCGGEELVCECSPLHEELGARTACTSESGVDGMRSCAGGTLSNCL